MSRATPDVIVPVGNPILGAKIFKAKCAQCHTIEKGGNVRTGPNLFDLFGQPSGSSNFQYSDANKNSGIVWSEKHLFEYLVNPKQYIPGTRMVFAGMKRPAERANLIAYMKKFTSQIPAASPLDAPIAASPVDAPIAASPLDAPIAASPVDAPTAASPVDAPIGVSHPASSQSGQADASHVHPALAAGIAIGGIVGVAGALYYGGFTCNIRKD